MAKKIPSTELVRALLVECGHAFVRELRFAPDQGDWRFDFAIPELKIGVEVEGGSWLGRPCPVCRLRPGGGHLRGERFESDCEKYNAATLLGWKVLRFTTRAVDEDPRYVSGVLQAACASAPAAPRRTPKPRRTSRKPRGSKHVRYVRRPTASKA